MYDCYVSDKNMSQLFYINVAEKKYACKCLYGYRFMYKYFFLEGNILLKDIKQSSFLL